MMTNAERIELIRQRLAGLQPTSLDIIDDSHKHVGHASAKGGGHFQVAIVAQAFAGKSLVQRHRMVYEAMGDAMEREIHALSIAAKTPEEASAG